MKTLKILIVGVLFIFITTTSAVAEQVCLPHEDAMEQLKGQFKEEVIGRGLSADGRALFELTLSKEGTWTVLMSRPNGQTCVIAGGENWQTKDLLILDPLI